MSQSINTSVPSVFSFESQPVRTISLDSGIWFVAADVCAALDIGNPTMALRRLDADEQALNSIEGSQFNVINESGLYSLILTSRKPEAKKFKRWVTSEVLPQIRKTGQYVPNQVEDAIEEISSSHIPQLKDIPAEVREAVDQKAMMIAFEAHEAIKKHLLRLVATQQLHGKVLVLDAVKIVQEESLNTTLTARKRQALRSFQIVAGIAKDNLVKLLDTLEHENPHPTRTLKG